jgi:hypothetical protein
MYPVYEEESSSNIIGWEYEYSDMEKNIKIGYDSYNFRDTYYNEDLIRDIQNMQLYKYLNYLDVSRRRPHFEFDCYVCLIDTNDMEDKLKILCEELFGCDEISYVSILHPTSSL